MAVTKREYIFATFLMSCLSVAFLIGAFATQNWVEGESTDEDGKYSVNYGLFQGTFVNTGLTKPDIYLTCILRDNACVFSCKTTKEVRKKEIESLLQGTRFTLGCDASTTTDGFLQEPLVWMKAGVHLSTVVFLSLGLILATLAAISGVYNTARSPIEPLVGVYGLYIWHGCAAFSCFFVLMLWGIHFAADFFDGLAFVHFMLIEFNSVTSSLGYSYWFVLASLLCHVVCEALLVLRFWLIAREPPPPTINIDKNTDNTIFLY